ncbi:hypothetical protein KUCAC02_026675, partial [Chaenocephalus aceratus]
MDWDRMKAKDLLALFNSFLPKGGAVLSVKIFPSEFGKQRLKGEETQDRWSSKLFPTTRRTTTRRRVRYYGHRCKDLRGVRRLRVREQLLGAGPTPKDVATDVNLAVYTPKVFTSSANATSKVQLTWDETDNERVTALERNFNKDELLAMDFKAYLASSSEEEEEGGGFVFGEPESEDDDSAAEEVVAQKKPEKVVEEKKEKKKKNKARSRSRSTESCWKGIQEKERKLHEEKDMGMEITWVP